LFVSIVALYNNRIADAEQEADGIVAIWNDRLLPNDEQKVLQNNFYTLMLAFAERA
jgi:hypothetical protein